MINRLLYWWRSQQFVRALKAGNIPRATRILLQLEASSRPGNSLVKIIRNHLNQTQDLRTLKAQIRRQEQQIFNLEEELQLKTKTSSFYPDRLATNSEFVQSIYQQFKLIDHDGYKLQCTGIDEAIFADFELNLANFLNRELSKSAQPEALRKALEDLEGLKKGIDPTYSEKLSAYVYFMKYFLDNVYCNYLVWFLVYQTGLLPQSPKILDIAAGPGTVAYGLALFLRSGHQFLENLPLNISYYSLEQQPLMQFRGLQFWRYYFEKQQFPPNLYFRFDTADIFEYGHSSKEIPQQFFDFVVISHCFFYEPQKRNIAHQFYRNIFQKNLQPQGYILLIVQGNKLFNLYDCKLSEDITQEKQVIQQFVAELGLELKWYKFLTSTDSRVPLGGKSFYHYALENLPGQAEMNLVRQQYLGRKFLSHYALDDYVVLAQNINLF